MRRLILCATAIAAVSISACSKEDDTANIGQSEPVNAVQDATGAAVGMAAAPTGAMTTDGYVTNAAIADMYEVEAGKLAAQKGSAAAVKSFGQMMVTDHTATTNELKPLATTAGVTPPAEPDERRKGFLDNLRAASGADFDRVYLDQQVAAHEEALTLHRSYADGGDNAALKAFAAKTAPKVEQHLQHVRGLRDGGGAAPAGSAAKK